MTSENESMSTAAQPHRSDLETICRAVAEGKKIDPEIVKRVKEKSDAIRRTIEGPSSVDILRSIREE
jgi:hypothetical protein